MQSIRILVVDDSTHIRRSIAELLASETWIRIVGEAADGLEAIEQVKAFHPTTVLLDIRLPVMDGFETAKRLRTSHNPPDIVLMTAHEGDEYPKKAMEVGASGFICRCFGK